MEFQQQFLDNGLAIVAECNPRAYSTALGFFVNTGSRDESPEIAGVSHFLEHMAFKGTARRSAEDVNRELDEMGSHSNARTGEERTIYHATVLPEFQSRAVELLADIMRPALRADDFESEKKVIIEEILMYEDQPPYGGHERIMASYFGQHPLSQSILGTPATVGGMSPESMHEYFRRQYSPNNMALVAAGNVDFAELVKTAQACCGAWDAFDVSRPTPLANPNFGFDVLHKEAAVQEYVLLLSQGPDARNDQRYASRLLSTIMGDDSGSRMFWEFIDTGAAEYAGMGAYEYDNCGVLLSVLCCAPEDTQANLERLAKLQATLEADGITERELKLAKRKIEAHLILQSERSESRMFAVGSNWLLRRNYRSLEEILADYEKQTLADVNAILTLYPLTQSNTLAVGPVLDLKPVQGQHHSSNR